MFVHLPVQSKSKRWRQVIDALPATESTDGALVGDNRGRGLLGTSNSRGSELTASSEADGRRGGGLHCVMRRRNRDVMDGR